MHNYKLYHLRMGLTAGSLFPGLLYLLVSVAMGVYAFKHTSYTFTSALQIHLTIISTMYWIMIGLFAIFVLWKITMLISFGLCPIKKYNVDKKLYSNLSEAEIKGASEKTKKFREEIQKWNKL